ncbi:hypothetical protein JH06_3418 [Blastocystis sp. subtype 4]|uniref:hypothetical protein n=1 Tax=Blastocystis sp. subtype 4 TaxID=944170 RepID=UPI00071183B9|nr:hypothetical protein JH06_3418 [Blastocystis sp. subtype 4]KNB44952.1 hypothetical protein JH06_3418 [Blastocystis sp. subtype 4]|eukprot:XP_014528387.1 hypothetical protein JH06_3418 [Blastocystis sp. subtype 4]
MTRCFCVDYTQAEDSGSHLPTTVAINLGSNYLIYSSSVSRPDYIRALAFSATNTPSSTPVKQPKATTISVRKNDKYSDQPLKTLALIRSDDRTINLSGIIVKAMNIQQCGSGDYKRNIFIVDESSTVPFLISVFFRDRCSGDVFSVLGSPVFFSTLKISSYKGGCTGVASSSYTGVTVFNIVQNKFESIHDSIDANSTVNRCNELSAWFMNLPSDVLSQLTKQQYSRLLASVSEEDVFDAVVKVVDIEPINQEYVASITCFDSSLVYLSPIPTNHTTVIRIDSQIRCDPVRLVFSLHF